MNRKSERRARRHAINELLACQEPPSRLDRLDQRSRMPNGLDCQDPPQAKPSAPRPQILEQAGPPRSETDLSTAIRTR